MPTFTNNETRVLRRCPHHRILGGVAAGVADYLGVDPITVRIALVVLTFLGGFAIPLYLAAWLLIPEEEAPRSIAEELLHPVPDHPVPDHPVTDHPATDS